MDEHDSVRTGGETADTPRHVAGPVPVFAVFLYVLAALIVSVMFPIVLMSWPEGLAYRAPSFDEFIPVLSWLLVMLACPAMLVGIGRCLTALEEIRENTRPASGHAQSD